MSFKERFKGKTTKIGKDGVEAVIGGSSSPIQKSIGANSELYKYEFLICLLYY